MIATETDVLVLSWPQPTSFVMRFVFIALAGLVSQVESRA